MRNLSHETHVAGLKDLSDSSLLIKLAEITANYNIEYRNQGIPERRSSSFAEKFWAAWDAGFPLARELADRERIRGTNVSHNSLWELVHRAFKMEYQKHFEHNRLVAVRTGDFEGLCKAISFNNRIAIGKYRLRPAGVSDYTDEYGQDQIGTQWELSENYTQFTCLRMSPEWRIAVFVYTLVNGDSPLSNQCGKWAELLHSASWSIYDGQYVPLNIRED